MGLLPYCKFATYLAKDTLLQINAIEEVLLARRFVVEAYPTIVLMKDG